MAKRDVLSCFDEWRQLNEFPDAPIPDPQADELLGLHSHSISREVNKMRELTEPDPLEPDWDQFLAEDLYTSPVEAHLQSVVLRAVIRWSQADPDTAPKPTLVRILKSRRLEPFGVQCPDGEHNFILLPTTFLKTIDQFWRGYFAGADFGRSLQAPRADTSNPSDYIGGRSVELGLRSGLDPCKEWMGLIVHQFVSHHVMSRLTGDPRGKPDEAIAQKLEELFLTSLGVSPPSDKPALQADGVSLIYLTTIFAVLHELSHFLLKHDLTRATKNEIEADTLGTLFYLAECRHIDTSSKARFPPSTSSVLGPGSFFEVFRARALVQSMLEGPGGSSSSDAFKEATAFLDEIEQRREEFLGFLESANDPKVPDEEHLVALLYLNEMQAATIGLEMLRRSIAEGRAVTFEEAVEGTSE